MVWKIIKVKNLFKTIFYSKDEIELQSIIDASAVILENSNWRSLGKNKSNYGLVKNQKSSPILTLIVKTTNSIDGSSNKNMFLSKKRY